jgi:hypothetical protein
MRGCRLAIRPTSSSSPRSRGAASITPIAPWTRAPARTPKRPGDRPAPADRAEVLDAIAAGLERRIDELVALEVAQSDVTVRQAHALHIGVALVSLRPFAQLARGYAFERPGPHIVRPRLAAGAVRREPIGVVAGIVPWNFPLLLGALEAWGRPRRRQLRGHEAGRDAADAAGLARVARGGPSLGC